MVWWLQQERERINRVQYLNKTWSTRRTKSRTDVRT